MFKISEKNKIAEKEKEKQKQKQKQKEEEEEEIKIDSLKDASIIIKNLIKENKNLKREINMMKEKFQNFEEYMKIMNLNCSYNKFDMEAYNLENVFEK